MPQAKSVFVVEDEQLIALHINSLLHELGYQTFPALASYEASVNFLKKNPVDLVILDIQLDTEKDGVDLAKYLKEQCHIPFIFLSSISDPDTFARARELQPYAYLSKPFRKEDLFTAIELALQRFESERQSQNTHKDYLFVNERGVYTKVHYCDILFAKSDHVYVQIHTRMGKQHLLRSSLSALCERLPDHFQRVHRSYVINMDCIDTIQTQHVLIQEYQIPISKNFRQSFMEELRIK